MLMVKLSEYVANFLADQGVTCAFGISGGASLHLIHALSENKKIAFVCPHHEQGAAMAADGNARSTGKIGVAVATSGPGATNLITGICCSYYDSVPVLFLTGQVSTFRMVNRTGVRQIGFQETPITEMVQPITKYCVKLEDPYLIKYELQKALHIAMSGRPGPVLIDIPDNLQREMIDPQKLKEFSSQETQICVTGFTDEQLQEFRMYVSEATRPILVAGWGLHLAGVQDQFRRFARALNIPVVATWGASNILSAEDPLYIGTFGTHGMRSANFAVQNADLVISLGARLDTKATGTPINTFARGAKKVMVDIDRAELDKFTHFGLSFDLLIHEDLRSFFTKADCYGFAELSDGYGAWFKKIQQWKMLEYSVDRTPSRRVMGVDPYIFFNHFSRALPLSSKVFIDTGCSIAWAMQGAKFDETQGVYHDFNNTAMGWALPAAIGSMIACNETPHYCVMGDGAFMMTMQELATVRHHGLPLKLFLMNNGGYSMIKQTQEQWLGAKYVASSSTDISFPDYEYVAKSFGFSYMEIRSTEAMDSVLSILCESNAPTIVNVVIPPEARVIPQVKFGRANEDMEPLLPRDVFNDAMIIEPLQSSL